jgi:hypothetical protein
VNPRDRIRKAASSARPDLTPSGVPEPDAFSCCRVLAALRPLALRDQVLAQVHERLAGTALLESFVETGLPEPREEVTP